MKVFKTQRHLAILVAIFVVLFLQSTGGFAASGGLAGDIVVDIGNGIGWVQQLKETMKEKNTTSERTELKSVLSEERVQSILARLQAGDPTHGVPSIEFKPRDEASDPGRLNGTFTVYGKAVEFKNLGEMNTKIRLRARVYLSFSQDLLTVKRAKVTKDSAFLEIKIKNPTPQERNGVNKYRLKLQDEDILTLFALDPKDPLFQQSLMKLQKKAIELENPPERVQAMFSVILKISQLKDGEEFIRPQYVVTYLRKSFTYTEKDYPVPVLTDVSDAEADPELAPPFVPKTIEYQLTFDDHITAFSPVAGDQLFKVKNYFGPDFHGTVVRYPENARAVEFKEPGEVAHLRDAYRSSLHRFFYRELIAPMEKEVWPGFEMNHGKAGQLSELLLKAS